MIHITVYFSIPLALLMLLLALNVSRLRIKFKVSLGTGNNKALEGAIRTHANAIENIPILLFLMLLFELSGGQTLWLWITGSTLVAARVLHAVGMLKRIFILRRISAVMTYLLFILLPLLLFMQMIGGGTH